jgi:hypothetical protein
MQHPTAHHPITADNLSWHEHLLIRLDEIVGLLDSIESKLTGCEEDREDGCPLSACQGYPTPDTRHLDTPNLSSVACHLSSATRPLPPNGQRLSPDAEEKAQ